MLCLCYRGLCPVFMCVSYRPVMHMYMLQRCVCHVCLCTCVHAVETHVMRIMCYRGHTAGQQGLDVVPTLSEMRFGQDKTEVFVYDLDPDMLEVKTIADRLLLVRSDGLRVLHPETMTPEPLLRSPSRWGSSLHSSICCFLRAFTSCLCLAKSETE